MDRHLVVMHQLRPSIKARYLRIYPKTWYSYISMRIELYGCRLGKPCFVVVFLFKVVLGSSIIDGSDCGDVREEIKKIFKIAKSNELVRIRFPTVRMIAKSMFRVSARG